MGTSLSAFRWHLLSMMQVTCILLMIPCCSPTLQECQSGLVSVPGLCLQSSTTASICLLDFSASRIFRRWIRHTTHIHTKMADRIWQSLAMCKLNTATYPQNLSTVADDVFLSVSGSVVFTTRLSAKTVRTSTSNNLRLSNMGTSPSAFRWHLLPAQRGSASHQRLCYQSACCHGPDRIEDWPHSGSRSRAASSSIHCHWETVAQQSKWQLVALVESLATNTRNSFGRKQDGYLSMRADGTRCSTSTFRSSVRRSVPCPWTVTRRKNPEKHCTKWAVSSSLMSIQNLSKCSFSTGNPEKQDLKASILSEDVFLLHVVPTHLHLSAFSMFLISFSQQTVRHHCGCPFAKLEGWSIAWLPLCERQDGSVFWKNLHWCPSQTSPNIENHHHKTWGRPVDSRLLSRLQPPRLSGFKLCSDRDESWMGNKKQTSHAKCLLCSGARKFAWFWLTKKRETQEIIGVGKSKVTKASEVRMAFWESNSLLLGFEEPYKWSSTTCKLNAHHWLNVWKKRLAPHKQTHQVFFCVQTNYYDDTHASALLYPSLPLLFQFVLMTL